MENKEHIYNIKAIRQDFDLDVAVRKMDKDEMPDDGVTYYCEETGQIYTEDELTFTDQPLERIPEETKKIGERNLVMVFDEETGEGIVTNI
jgi:hypothetical protein